VRRWRGSRSSSAWSPKAPRDAQLRTNLVAAHLVEEERVGRRSPRRLRTRPSLARPSPS
jgi:hypothetical protein